MSDNRVCRIIEVLQYTINNPLNDDGVISLIDQRDPMEVSDWPCFGVI